MMRCAIVPLFVQKMCAFSYIAYNLQRGHTYQDLCRTETILTHHEPELSRKLHRVDFSSLPYSFTSQSQSRGLPVIRPGSTPPACVSRMAVCGVCTYIAACVEIVLLK
jgi:hypothetical protein